MKLPGFWYFVTEGAGNKAMVLKTLLFPVANSPWKEPRGYDQAPSLSRAAGEQDEAWTQLL